MSFSLILFEGNPPTSSVVNNSNVIGGTEEGARRRVKWARTTLWGKVIKIGKSKELHSSHAYPLQSTLRKFYTLSTLSVTLLVNLSLKRAWLLFVRSFLLCTHSRTYRFHFRNQERSVEDYRLRRRRHLGRDPGAQLCTSPGEKTSC